MREATVAAVDIGTNSVKMTVARGGVVLAERTTVTRLGEGVAKSGRLSDAAIERTTAALRAMAAEARSLGSTRIAAVATSAVRDAANGAEFARDASGILGGPVETISGDREARLVHGAALADPDRRRVPGALLVAVDVGGGSTEIVVGDDTGIRHAVSLQLGAVRLAETAGLLGDAALSDSAIQGGVELVDAALQSLPVPEGALDIAASGGTAANLAGIAIGALDPSRLHGAVLDTTWIEAEIRRLAGKSLAERRTVPGLEPDRADVIVAGAIVLARCARKFGCDTVRVSLRGVRHGLLAELAGAG